MHKTRFVFVSAFLSLSLVLAACGGNKGAGGTQPGAKGAATTLVVARTISDAVSLDPAVAYEFSSVSSAHALYSNLVTYAKGDTSGVLPEVAQTWDMTPDGKTWTFQLKKGLKFASGNEVTAADVVYSFERVVNIPKNPAAWLLTDNMGITKENVAQAVTAPDPYTVKITLAQSFAPGAFLSIMTFPTTGIVEAKLVKQHIDNGDYGTKWLSEHSAGSAPYVLEKWEHDNQIVLSANAGYNIGPAPAIKRVILKHVAENTAQLDQLKKGDVDVAMTLSAEQLKTLQGDSNFAVQQTPDLALTYLGLDVKNVPAFAKPEVRQAIKYALDYKGIIDHLLSGNALPTQGIVPKGIYGYQSSTPFSQNVEQAKGLLAKAGYPNGFNVELTISNAVLSGGVSPQDLGAQIKNDLAKIGINISLRQMTAAELYKLYRGQQLQMVLANWSVDYPDPDDFAKPFGNFASKSLGWRLQWDDQELAQLVQQAGTLPNSEARAKLYQQIDQIMKDRSPFAIMYQPLVSTAASSKVQSLTYNPIWGIEFSSIAKQ